MALCLVFTPASLALGLFGYPMLILLPPLLSSIYLLVLNTTSFIRLFYLFYDGGCCSLATLHSFFITPLVLLLVASVMPFMGSSWKSVTVPLVLAKFLGLPALYMQRPTYAVMAGFLFIQTSICISVIATKVQGGSGIPKADGALGVTACATLFMYRRWLFDIWDVSLRIRPGAQCEVKDQSLSKIFTRKNLSAAWKEMNIFKGKSSQSASSAKMPPKVEVSDVSKLKKGWLWTRKAKNVGESVEKLPENDGMVSGSGDAGLEEDVEAGTGEV